MLTNFTKYFGWTTAQMMVLPGSRSAALADSIASIYRASNWELRLAFADGVTASSSIGERIDARLTGIKKFPSRCLSY